MVLPQRQQVSVSSAVTECHVILTACVLIKFKSFALCLFGLHVRHNFIKLLCVDFSYFVTLVDYRLFFNGCSIVVRSLFDGRDHHVFVRVIMSSLSYRVNMLTSVFFEVKGSTGISLGLR